MCEHITNIFKLRYHKVKLFIIDRALLGLGFCKRDPPFFVVEESIFHKYINENEITVKYIILTGPLLLPALRLYPLPQFLSSVDTSRGHKRPEEGGRRGERFFL